MLTKFQNPHYRLFNLDLKLAVDLYQCPYEARSMFFRATPNFVVFQFTQSGVIRDVIRRD